MGQIFECNTTFRKDILFDPNEYFKNEDYYEPYEYSATYKTTVFKHDYGYGTRNYLNVIHNIKIGDRITKYLVPTEQITDEELKILIPYCECQYHKTYWPFSLFICKCCVGCIDSSCPNKQYILSARLAISMNVTEETPLLSSE